VDTRLKKLDAGEFDALILAEAGLARLGLASRIRERLSADWCLPSVGQGVIAIECLKSRHDLVQLLQGLNHAETEACILAERAMNHALGASCTSPVGSFAQLESGVLTLRGAVWTVDGKQCASTLQQSKPEEAIALGQLAARDLLSKMKLEFSLPG
jgi:hydroxymethylbilane synthase